MPDDIDQLTSAFIDEVADWLLATKDERLVIGAEGTKARITNVCSACADFCEFMAEICAADGDPKDWRNILQPKASGITITSQGEPID